MIIGLEEVKNYLAIKSPNNDHELTPLVDYVNSYITTFCSLKDNTGQHTCRVTSHNGRSALLPTDSLNVSIDSIKSNGLTLDTEDYHLDEDSGIIVFYTEVSTKPYGLSITYTEGALVIPSDLHLAGLEMVKYFYKDEYKNAVSSGQGDTVSFEISSTIPNKIRHILTQYRKF